MVGKKDIENFYNSKKIAVIGVSRNKKKYGNMVFSELKKRGYDVIPVNPHASEINGYKAYATIKDIKNKIDAVLIIVPASQQEKVAKECVDLGIKMVWMHEHIMKGVTNPIALAIIANSGATLITGFCPFMFMPGSGFPHNLHKAILGFFKALPK
ncbi:MAG: CoA-binding protein [Candidatus Goldbacteria bacterium]|nr:CoA-binding protein [Candidatus Goldiibacteriota bacterium]